MSPHPHDKHALRLRGRTARRAVRDDTRASLAAAAAERLLALPELESARVVLVYGASAEEIDPGPAIAALRERGVIIAYPRVSEPGRLTLHRVDADDVLETGTYGIREPAADAPAIDPADIDAAVVPGVAFCTACCRVGHGGGYYDRLLATLTRAFKVGLAYDGQVFDAVPTEEHDVAVDMVVTPARTLSGRAHRS